MQDNVSIFSSLHAVKSVPLPDFRYANLPVQLTPFIGREQEIQAACTLLHHPGVHLLTFTGTGGVGKTRLALQVMEKLRNDFADGLCFVPLDAITDPQAVISTIVDTLDLWKNGACERGYSAIQVLKIYLRDRQQLLLLDNFEQVVSAAPLLVELLQACPQLKILVTSRTVLHVSGEHEFLVSPLALPNLKHGFDDATLAQCAAVALFIQRARAIKPDLQFTPANVRIIAQICTRLDGLPLAIELAATRIKLLPPQTLLTKLNRCLQLLAGGAQDAPMRQQTLRNTLIWSYNLLHHSEQWLFRRLSVFVGGCSLEAAVAVANVTNDLGIDILDGVAALLDKSLLQAQSEREPRLLLLETTREYGLECLLTSGELEVMQQAHAAYYLVLAEKAVPHLRGREQAIWLERLDREYENIVAALHWSIARGGETAERSLRLGGALAIFWWIRGHLSEVKDILEQALAGSGEYAVTTRAKAFYEVGWMFIPTDTVQAEALSMESLKLYRMLGNQQGIAETLNSLGQIAWHRGNFAEGCLLLEDSLMLFRGICDKGSVAWTVLCLACIALDQGESPKAFPYLEESLMLFREIGSTLGVAYALKNLARAFLDKGDALAAFPLLEESLQLFRELGDKTLTARTLAYLGRACALQGESIRARALFKEALATFQEKEAQRDIALSLFFLANVAVAQKDYVAARPLYEESLTIFKEVNYRGGVDIPCCLEGLARAVVGQGQPAWAARLAGAAEILRETIGVRLLPVEQPVYEKLILAIRTQLGKQVFVAMWAEGRAMTLEQVLAPQGQESVMVLPLIAGKQSYPANLTEREMEVLRLLVNGLTNNKIAEQLIISSHTVNAHVRSIFNKLEVNSRSALTRSALERNLI